MVESVGTGGLVFFYCQGKINSVCEEVAGRVFEPCW